MLGTGRWDGDGDGGGDGDNVNVTHPTTIEDPIPVGPVSPGDDDPILQPIEPED